MSAIRLMQSGTALWFARHEMRLAWRDWVAMMTAGSARAAIGSRSACFAFAIVLHAVAYFVVGRLRRRHAR